jgi:uncharacterized delta-60 repeat protein
VGIATGAPSGASRPSWGQSGHVVMQSNAACVAHGCPEFGGSYAEAVVVRPDGDVVLGGSNNYIGAGAREGQPAGALAEIDSEGSPEATFGEGRGVDGVPFAVKHLYELPAGELLALGSREGQGAEVAEYSATGRLNTSFATHGVLAIATPPGLVDVRRESGGDYVALGGEGEGKIRVARYLASGAPEAKFGHAGSVRLSFQKYVIPVAFAVLKSGQIAVLARTGKPDEDERSGGLFLTLVEASGIVNRAFGKHGIAYLPIAHAGRATIAGISSGAIVVAASASRNGKARDDELAVTRYTRSGKVDRSFGVHGVSRTVFPYATGAEHFVGVSPTAIAFGSTGEMIVVGERPILTVDVPRGVGFVAKYTARGRDCAFGSGGLIVDSELGGANAVATQPSGNITVAGWSEKAFAAARYPSDGQPWVCPGE